MYPRIHKPMSRGSKAKAKKVVNGGKRTNSRKNTPVSNKHNVIPRKGPAVTALMKIPKMESKTLTNLGRKFIFKILAVLF